MVPVQNDPELSLMDTVELTTSPVVLERVPPMMLKVFSSLHASGNEGVGDGVDGDVGVLGAWVSWGDFDPIVSRSAGCLGPRRSELSVELHPNVLVQKAVTTKA